MPLAHLWRGSNSDQSVSRETMDSSIMCSLLASNGPEEVDRNNQTRLFLPGSCLNQLCSLCVVPTGIKLIAQEG